MNGFSCEKGLTLKKKKKIPYLGPDSLFIIYNYFYFCFLFKLEGIIG